jgi:hypothetical protein
MPPDPAARLATRNLLENADLEMTLKTRISGTECCFTEHGQRSQDLEHLTERICADLVASNGQPGVHDLIGSG